MTAPTATAPDTEAHASPWQTSGTDRAADDACILERVGEIVSEVRAGDWTPSHRGPESPPARLPAPGPELAAAR